MSKVHGKIIGTGSELPSKVLTNDDLSKMVDTNDEWITDRTGIKARRVSSAEIATSDLAIPAAQKAIKDAGIDPLELDLIIAGTCTPDTLFPSLATMIQHQVGAKNAAAFDVSAACSGFNFALTVANNFIENGTYKKILVVGADTLTKYLDWTDRGTCILFGDGAGAVVLAAANDGAGIQNSFLKAEGEGGKFLVMPGGGSRDPENKNGRFIKMQGQDVFKFAVRVLEEAILKVIEPAGLKLSDINLLIPHQANKRIINHVMKKFHLTEDQVFVNLQNYGNTSAASIPIAIDEAKRAGRMKPGDNVVIVGFGAGLTCGANLIKW
jgi:3-oxoacyl-[acyl-carrier-protein] synthase-3